MDNVRNFGFSPALSLPSLNIDRDGLMINADNKQRNDIKSRNKIGDDQREKELAEQFDDYVDKTRKVDDDTFSSDEEEDNDEDVLVYQDDESDSGAADLYNIP